MQEQLYVGGLYPLQNRGYRLAMGRGLAAKIKHLRLSKGWNQTDLAERLGVTQASVSRWEKGSIPEADKLAQLADLAQESVGAFIGNSPLEAPNELLNRFWVRGTVAAGVWALAYEWPEDDWTPYSGRTDIEVNGGKRFGLRVSGDSMNEVYPDGTILDCVCIESVPEIRSGQRAIVERQKFDGTVEATAKEYLRSENGEVWLLPRSTNPAFQAPINPAAPGEGISEVRVVAVVVGSYRPE